MKRLITILAAVMALVVMAIAAGVVRAEGGDDGTGDHSTTQTQTQTQPCGESQSGDDNEANDTRARTSEDSEGTSGSDDHHGTTGNDTFSGRAGDDQAEG